jgi:hypothetical protein
MSGLEGSGALVLWIDVAPALQAETDAWYVDEHLPDRVRVAGYRRASRYVAVSGSPRYLSVFEADTPQALASDGYLSLVRQISPQSQRIRAGFSNVARNTFTVRASAARARGGLVASLRLVPAAAPDGSAPSAALAVIDALVPRLLMEHCIVGAHWLQSAPEVRATMDAVRAVGTADAAVDHVLLVEATQAHELDALRQGPLSETALRAAGWQLTAFGIYQLLCTMDAADCAQSAP